MRLQKHHMNDLELFGLTCLVVPDMKLTPNVGSDRSWVWNAAADVSEGEPEPVTLAIRFANSESKWSGIITYYCADFSTKMQSYSRTHSKQRGRRI